MRREHSVPADGGPVREDPIAAALADIPKRKTWKVELTWTGWVEQWCRPPTWETRTETLHVWASSESRARRIAAGRTGKDVVTCEVAS